MHVSRETWFGAAMEAVTLALVCRLATRKGGSAFEYVGKMCIRDRCSRVSYCEVNRIDHLVTNSNAQKQPAYAAVKAAVGKLLVV